MTIAFSLVTFFFSKKKVTYILISSTLNKKARGLLITAACLFLIAYVSTNAIAAEASYVDELVETARSMRLHEKRQWQTLLHYRHTTFHGYESLVDDPRFFNSKDGKHNPQKELEETLRAFFRTDVKGDDHPQCRFPARLNWLKKELNITKGMLPGEDCKGLNELLAASRPESIVLIFPVGHMNSPASMFGHTLLRIDSTLESKLVSYAINYAASTGDDTGFRFVFKGIFGYYKGFYTFLPYYEKIKEYSNLDNRDMWEYKLNFNKEEVLRLVKHVWELKDVYVYYYFFDKNCSYELLMLLEAARPDVNLLDSLPPWIMPMDTVRDVQNNRMCTDDVYYRPSRASKIKFIESRETPEFNDVAKTIVAGDVDPDAFGDNSGAAVKNRINTLELASEFIQYQYAKQKIEKEVFLKRYLKILSARSKLGPGPDDKLPAPAPPEAGHFAARLSLGFGTKGANSYQLLKLRPANHELMDPDPGYLPGAGISFLDAEFHHTNRDDKFSLGRLTLVEITSISSMDRLFRPISWELITDVTREEFAKDRHRTVVGARGGPGAAFNVLDNGLVYGLVEPTAKIARQLDKGYALGIGATVGFLKPITDAWKVQVLIKGATFDLGDRHRVFDIELNQRYTINRNNAIRLNFKRERFSGFYSNDVSLSWNRYF